MKEYVPAPTLVLPRLGRVLHSSAWGRRIHFLLHTLQAVDTNYRVLSDKLLSKVVAKYCVAHHPVDYRRR